MGKHSKKFARGAPIKTSRFIEGGGEDEAGVFGEGYMGEVVFVAREAGYRCARREVPYACGEVFCVGD
jgi:hypothetical protein